MVKKLLIINKESLDSIGSKQLAVVYLKHPRTQKPMPFLAVETTDNQMLIYELKSYSPDLSSVFIDDYVQMDAFVYLAAEFNINYFLIDFLKDLNCKNQQFKNIDEFKKMFLSNLISDSIDQKQFENMLEKIVITEERLNKLFKINQSQNFEIEFDQSKCMDWLKNKFNSLLRKFEEASDENDLKKPKAKSSARAELDTFKFKNEAFELVCQYLGDNLCQMLSKEVGLTLSFNTFTQDNKRIKT